MIVPDLAGLPPNLLVGTSSWSSRDWEGVFYPPGTPPGDYIAEYSKRLPTVEIDASFYRPPSARMVEAWVRKTPPGFLFAAKVPQSITHEKALVGCDEEIAAFVGTMSRLGDRLGPLVLQFPYVAKGRDEHEYRTGATFRRRLAAFLENLPSGPRFAVEIRNERWLDEDLLSLLRSRSMALVLSDYTTMPSLPRLEGRLDPVTADFALVRFLGNRRRMDERIARLRADGKAKEFDSLVVDRTGEMRAWAPALRRLLPRVRRLLAYFNNHYAGFGPGSVDLFARVWRETAPA